MADQTKTSDRVDPHPLARTIGVLVAVLTGVFAVGVGIYVSHGIGPMVALTLVIGLALVTGFIRSRERWAPLVLGSVIGINWLFLAWVEYYTHSPDAIYTPIVILLIFLLAL